jgi:Arm domain-containing DNA-binding protein
MLETSFSILFYLKKPKGYTKGDVPVYMRITVNGARKEIGTKHSCDPDRWNSDAQRAKGTNESSKTINAYLDTLERKVHDGRLKLLENSKAVTPEAILTGQEEKPLMLLEIFEHHNAQMAALENIEYAPATVKRLRYYVRAYPVIYCMEIQPT